MLDDNREAEHDMYVFNYLHIFFKERVHGCIILYSVHIKRRFTQSPSWQMRCLPSRDFSRSVHTLQFGAGCTFSLFVCPNLHFCAYILLLGPNFQTKSPPPPPTLPGNTWHLPFSCILGLLSLGTLLPV